MSIQYSLIHITLDGIHDVRKSSWKKRQVGKSQVKLESSEILAVTLSYFIDNFPSSARIFQPQKKLSNFARFFPTSLGSFQLKQKLSIFRLANFSFFPIALSNWKRAVGKNEELESSTCYQKEWNNFMELGNNFMENSGRSWKIFN